MTKLEKMINSVCYDSHKDDPAFEDFEYDLQDGHYHVTPIPPDCWEYITYSDNPAEIYTCCDNSLSIAELIELRDWLNEVLQEGEK